MQRIVITTGEWTRLRPQLLGYGAASKGDNGREAKPDSNFMNLGFLRGLRVKRRLFFGKGCLI